MFTVRKALGVVVALLLPVAADFAAGKLSDNRPREVSAEMSATSAQSSAPEARRQSPRDTNRLADETSPYLLQHAHNPVDWYAWSEEAFTRAKKENKPIFLSIGYSACHWCHVMERESFEDEVTAAILNEHFISIKVDREERPDVDEIYMTAVQMMTGSGGWPLTVFLTADLKPFYGGTYFPPESRYGRPGFRDLLERIAKVWVESPGDIRQNADRLMGALHAHAASRATPSPELDTQIISDAVRQLERTYDGKWGGFGRAPKFPPSAAISLLLRQYARTGDEKLLEMARNTLDRMARGGMYDQIGGGFHRYSTDGRWLVPHFEKMLYDNALLSRAYLEAWQVTHDDLYRRIATETMDYVLRDMTDERGGFHSAEDADSEGEEGVFYVWTPAELTAALGEEDGGLFSAYYGVTESGSFEGRSILHVPVEPAAFAREAGLSLSELAGRLARLREKVHGIREQRGRPGRDDKVLAAWNGMMISALARGYQVLGEERFRLAAERAADFVLTRMVRDGELLRVYTDRGGEDDQGLAKLPAYLNDYAEMANGLVDLYEATFDLRWLGAAVELTDRMIADFRDEQRGGFFYTSAAHRNLIVRTRPLHDGAVPSGNSTAAMVLLRLARLMDDDSYRGRAEEVLLAAAAEMSDRPTACLNLLWAADFYLRPGPEFAIVGVEGSEETRRLLQEIHRRFIPNKILALAAPDTEAYEAAVSRIPLLQKRSMVDGLPTVYMCRDFVCRQPITDVDALAAALNHRSDGPSAAAGTDSAEQDGGRP
ncbi:MAG: thioredoxin domain-containing protein [Phycisphaerales bacterium]|nr:MAG: thioredoxin domain-containing protein [Phycisphaerales bacterium]